MLHLLYILAFTIIAFLAVSNLIRSLISVSMDSQRRYSTTKQNPLRQRSRSGKIIHPELLDERGQPINEPLLVMRSVSVEDAREQLDALYHSSANPTLDFPESEDEI